MKTPIKKFSKKKRKWLAAFCLSIWLIFCGAIVVEQPLRVFNALVTSGGIQSLQGASTKDLRRAFHMHFLSYGVYIPASFFRPSVIPSKTSSENTVAFSGKKVRLEVWLPLQFRLPLLGTLTRIVNWKL